MEDFILKELFGFRADATLQMQNAHRQWHGIKKCQIQLLTATTSAVYLKKSVCSVHKRTKPNKLHISAKVSKCLIMPVQTPVAMTQKGKKRLISSNTLALVHTHRN